MRSVNHTSQIIQWQKILSDLQQENAMLKIKLSELVDNSVMTDFLQQAESIHNELISNDTSILVLTKSLNQVRELFSAPHPQVSDILSEKISALTKDIRKFQKHFCRLSATISEGLITRSAI